MAKAQERIVPKTGKTVTKRTPAQRTATTRESWPSRGESKHGRGHPKTTAKNQDRRGPRRQRSGKSVRRRSAPWPSAGQNVSLWMRSGAGRSRSG